MKIEQDELLNKINIVDLISEYVQLSAKGSSYVGLSPFKKENTPSFMVSPQKNIFKDFSSGIGGNAIKFYMLINNISYKEAIYELAKKYNVKISGFKQYDDKNKIYYDILEKTANYYKSELKKSEKALNYLVNVRKYNEKDIDDFKLGYASDSWNGLLEELLKTYSIEEIFKIGLIAEKNENYYDIFRNRIIFPIYNINGKVVGFGGRDITNEDNGAKYINSKESEIFKKSNELYGIFDRGDLIKKYDNCLLVEGFFDVLALHKNNIKTAVASLGTSLTKNQVKYISKLTNNIVIAYDDDDAGLQAKIRAIYLLNEEGFNIKIMSLENKAKDPDEFLKKYGREEFVSQYNKAIDPIDFLYNHFNKDLDLSTIVAKRKLLNLLKPYFSSITSSIIFDDALKKIATKLEINYLVVEKELNISLKRHTENKTVYKKNNYNDYVKDDNKLQLEKQTISLIQKDIKKYHNKFSYFEFSNPIYASIYYKMSLGDYSVSALDEEETIALLDINTSVNSIKDEEKEYIILFRLWVIRYIEASLEYLQIKLNDFKNQEFKEFLEQKSNVKKIKNSMNIEEIEKVFKAYVNYEERNLYE